MKNERNILNKKPIIYVIWSDIFNGYFCVTKVTILCNKSNHSLCHNEWLLLVDDVLEICVHDDKRFLLLYDNMTYDHIVRITRLMWCCVLTDSPMMLSQSSGLKQVCGHILTEGRALVHLKFYCDEIFSVFCVLTATHCTFYNTRYNVNFVHFHVEDVFSRRIIYLCHLNNCSYLYQSGQRYCNGVQAKLDILYGFFMHRKLVCLKN